MASCKVIGVTVETDGITEEQLEEAKIFSGKNAGICYMKENYFDSELSGSEASLKRFRSTILNTHHSISDHVRVEVLFENCSKMLAIVLNSLRDYSTSERSGRYTVMTGNSDKERELYDKWLKIFRGRLLELNSSMDDEMLVKLWKKKYADINGYEIKNGLLHGVDEEIDFETGKAIVAYWTEIKENPTLPSYKLAQENARYVLSVFTRSTTMGYSTSIRQWNYIHDWCGKYLRRFDMRKDGLYEIAADAKATYFDSEMYKDLSDLYDFIKEKLYVENMRDCNKRSFDFLEGCDSYSKSPINSIRDCDCSYKDSYLTVYEASFVHLAQAERHRTLKYLVRFDTRMQGKLFYIPRCLVGSGLEYAWFEDLRSVSDLIPQATLITVFESGHISDFLLKCNERLCSKAQLEICVQTKNTLQLFDSENELSNGYQSIVSTMVHPKVATKCNLRGICTTPCAYASHTDDVFTRKY